MYALALLLAWAAAPFWETRPPAAWTDAELSGFLADSPWAQLAGPAPGVTIYLATARPMREAEAELYRRARLRQAHLPEVADLDYADFLRTEGARHIVIAVPFPDTLALADAAEYKRMEQESVLKIGRRTYKMSGHFPPVAADPRLRMAFPRDVRAGDKSLYFELYLPGVGGNFKSADFRFKELNYRGRVEY